jgi:hypothetical protein
LSTLHKQESSGPLHLRRYFDGGGGRSKHIGGPISRSQKQFKMSAKTGAVTQERT